MSVTLLLEKYDVSTEEGLQKALNDIEKEEAEVDEALSGALSRACLLEGRLRSASQAYVKLGEVKVDAEAASDMVDKTANLARDVSAKVRQLDLARSRVAECQMRVNDLIDLQLCSAGVEAAIKAHDYETGAGHVARFLSMDPGSVAAARARGAPDPRRAMAKAAETLREHLVNKFEEAARKEDDAAVERLFKLFPQIGRADEGVDLLGKYLASQAEASIRASSTGSAGSGGGAVQLDAARAALRAGVAAAERARRAAPTRLPRALAHIQPVVSSGVRRVAAAARASGPGPAAGRDALTAEPAAAELALLHHTVLLYFASLRRKTQADAASLDEAGKKAAMDEIEKIIAESDLTRVAQEILGHYLELERFFLEESIDKALKMANSQAGESTSSLVDDVFFIVNKVIKRGISTGSVDGACCVLNEAGAGLERAAAALRRALRAPPDPLPLPAPPPAPPAPAAGPEPELDAQRALFLAHAAEAEAGGEWAERLAEEAARAGAALEGGRGADKARQCAAGLGAAGAAFRAAHDLALRAARAALRPRLLAWADALAAPGPVAGEEGPPAEEDADALPAALDALAEAARAALSARATDALLAAAVHDIADRAEEKMLHHTYDRVDGMCVERRARRLAAWAGGCGAAGARERCARLTQAAALLALDAPAHAPLALLPAPRLAPQHARDLLARRSDFKMEDIKRLKL